MIYSADLVATPRAPMAPRRAVRRRSAGAGASSASCRAAGRGRAVRFAPPELQRAWERLGTGDPVHGLLARIAGDEARDARLPMPAHLASPGALRRHRATLAVVGLYALLALLPGLLISVFGGRPTDREFVKLTDWRELPGALFLYLVLAPVLWTFYLWQPRLIVDVFAGLAEGGVVGEPRSAG